MNDDIKNLERDLFARPKSATAENLEKLVRYYWDLYAKETKVREKPKLIGKSAYFAVWAADVGENRPEILELYLKVVRAEKNSKNISYVTGKWIKAAGLGEVKIIMEKKIDVAVESGMVGMGEPGENGSAVSIETGGDGNMKTVFRLVESLEPVLKIEEYKYVEAASDTGKLFLSDGRLKIGDLWEVKSGNEGSDITIDPGWYKGALYLIERATGPDLIAVICKITEEI